MHVFKRKEPGRARQRGRLACIDLHVEPRLVGEVSPQAIAFAARDAGLQVALVGIVRAAQVHGIVDVEHRKIRIDAGVHLQRLDQHAHHHRIARCAVFIGAVVGVSLQEP